ncbi:Na(+)/H(+) antiporter subunit F1 [Salinicoccus halodurans]|uniref:Monovalent cation/H+ antiporter subunit F n=1 Tax=Salinicoccus halodurans TaxID=407035 RepID=A0A0F7HIC9_9STAP|nr:Na(+)/H(+) antiporter subunit F1 [Salinicoccus halodurans]AKG73302.1 monovalent cation/H+ antiporter subunit F [Salinicoccus halodurans]SFK82670.1 multisubunit sodium/proton antiporter, MrpF subunit [Salinicoccus halodurans]
MNTFLDVVIIFSIIVLAFAMLGMVYRMLKGPTLHDKLVALDAFGVLLMGMIALTAMMLQTTYLLVVVLLIGIIAFVATIAFAKFLEKGVIIQYDRNSDE